MPVSKKSVVISNGVSGMPIKGRYPRRVVVFVVVRDESGSMAPYRQEQGTFIPAVAQSLIEIGGPRIAELVYVLYAVISGGVVMTEFQPLSKAADPNFVPDGATPIGTALESVASKCASFLENELFSNEVTVRNFEIVIFSDLHATEESPERTAAGVDAFVSFAKKYNAKVNLVGPNAEAMNRDLASRLDINERGVKYLDSDPKAILKITFDSLLSASRVTLGGSNPIIRNA